MSLENVLINILASQNFKILNSHSYLYYITIEFNLSRLNHVIFLQYYIIYNISWLLSWLKLTFINVLISRISKFLNLYL
jgi:hypothetical protein